MILVDETYQGVCWAFPTLVLRTDRPCSCAELVAVGGPVETVLVSLALEIVACLEALAYP